MFIDSHLLISYLLSKSSHVERAKLLSRVSFIRNLIPFMSLHLYDLINLSRTLSPNTVMLQLNLNIRLLEGYKDLIYCRACLLKCKWKTKVTSRDEEVKERFPREINSDLRIKKINVWVTPQGRVLR